MKILLSKRSRLLVSVAILIAALASTATFASSGSRTLEVFYRNIQIYVDGTLSTPTDINGKLTEPFIMNGTTYLPVHAISKALGQKVVWDEAANSIYVGANPQNTVELYAAAVLDAMVIGEDDIFPLIEINKDGDMCSWNDKGQVLMLTYHSYPDSYVAGEDYTLRYGQVWTFTDKEIIKWYNENKKGVTDWELRFKQLIGLPEGRPYTHFSAFWTDPEDITRPGYAWKLSDTIGSAAFADKPSDEYKAWFNGNIIWSYYDSAYPWTRLGYTYDWAAGSGKYGLSEFLIQKDAVVHVEFTLSTDEFLAWLDAQ